MTAIITMIVSRPPVVMVMTVLGGALVLGIALWVLGHRVRSGKTTNVRAQMIVVATSIAVVATAFILGELLRRSGE